MCRSLVDALTQVNPQYQDLYRRDLQRLAAWPPKFRGEGPFLPTGRRRSPRLLLPSLALAAVALTSMAGLHWRPAPDEGARTAPVETRAAEPVARTPRGSDSASTAR